MLVVEDDPAYAEVLAATFHRAGQAATCVSDGGQALAVFRRAYDALLDRLGSAADVEYVRILHLAASTSEAAVEAALNALIESEQLRDYAQVRAAAAPEPVEVPSCAIEPPDLSAYDAITAVGGEQ